LTSEPKPYHPPAARLRSIVECITSSSACNAETLAHKLGVTRRTIVRDIQYLRDSQGFNIVYIRKSKRYVMEGGFPKVGSMEIGIAEILAIILGADAMHRLGDSYHSELIKKVCAILQVHHSEQLSVDFERFSKPISYAVTQTAPPNTNHIETIVISTRQCTSIKLHYNSVRSSRQAWRKVDPLHLHCRFGTWYLIAWCHTRKDILLFRCDRMLEVQPTTQHFEQHKFNQDEYLGNSLAMYRGAELIHVELRVAVGAVRWFRERTFHSTQSIVQANHEAPATVTLDVIHGPDLEHWILGWGEEVEVMGPEELRKQIQQRIEGMWGVYEGE